MPHIVTDLCVDCKHTTCVSVCPVDCFHEDERTLWIDPVECIDCGACIPECPEKAIFTLADLPKEYHHNILENAERSKVLPVILDSSTPLLIGDHCTGGGSGSA